MSRRWVFLGLGLVVGVLAVRIAAEAAQQAAAQPGGGSLGDRVREFLAEVRVGMAEREAELRTELGLDGSHDAVDAGL